MPFILKQKQKSTWHSEVLRRCYVRRCFVSESEDIDEGLGLWELSREIIEVEENCYRSCWRRKLLLRGGRRLRGGKRLYVHRRRCVLIFFFSSQVLQTATLMFFKGIAGSTTRNKLCRTFTIAGSTTRNVKFFKTHCGLYNPQFKKISKLHCGL